MERRRIGDFESIARGQKRDELRGVSAWCEGINKPAAVRIFSEENSYAPARRPRDTASNLFMPYTVSRQPLKYSLTLTDVRRSTDCFFFLLRESSSASSWPTASSASCIVAPQHSARYTAPEAGAGALYWRGLSGRRSETCRLQRACARHRCATRLRYQAGCL